MPQYTVQDTTSGKQVTFDWNDKVPPTDADMEQVFAAAGVTLPPAGEQGEPTFAVPPSGQTYLRSRDWRDTAREYIGEGTGILGAIGGQALLPEVPGKAAAGGYAIGKQLGGVIGREFLTNPLDIQSGQADKTPTGMDQAWEMAKDTALGYVGGKIVQGAPRLLGYAPPMVPSLGIGKNIYDRLAMGTYKSALKPSTANILEQNDTIVLAALRDRILPYGEKSVAKIDYLNGEINRTFNDVLALKSVNTQMLPTKPIKDAINNTISFYENSPVTSKMAEGLRKEFAHWENIPDYWPVNKMAQERTIMNNQLSDFYRRSKTLIGQNANEKLSAETLKSVRDATSNVLYELAPELRYLSKRQAALIDLNGSIERATNRINNWDLVGLSSLVAGVGAETLGYDKTGKALTGAGGTVLAFRLLSNPNIKARIAFALAQEGRLTTVAPSTLNLIGLTRESAINIQPILKALPAPPRVMPGQMSESYVRGYSSAGATEGGYLGPRALGPSNLLSLPPIGGTSAPSSMRGSRGLLFDQFGLGASNPAYQVTDEELLRAIRSVPKR